MIGDSVRQVAMENQKRMEQHYKKEAKRHSGDRRYLILAFFLSLLLKQGIDLIFASETTLALVVNTAGVVANHVEDSLDDLLRFAAECEALASSSVPCTIATRFKHWNDASDAKREAAGAAQEGFDDSGTIHVVEKHNITQILRDSAEDDDFVATIVKTHTEEDHERTEARDLSQGTSTSPASSERRVYKHPLLERVVHSPLFIQFILPLLTACFAAVFITYLPNTNNTAVTSFFLLIMYIFGRICLILY